MSAQSRFSVTFYFFGVEKNATSVTGSVSGAKSSKRIAAPRFSSCTMEWPKADFAWGLSRSDINRGKRNISGSEQNRQGVHKKPFGLPKGCGKFGSWC